jgi:hypothetical protein
VLDRLCPQFVLALTMKHSDRFNLRRDWNSLLSLTPGDFAAVQRQGEILGSTLDAHEFMAQLEGEHRPKPAVRLRRGIGFTR